MLERARLLLHERDSNVADIAVEAGFFDEAHLSRLFKSRYGTTPARYRRSLYAVCGRFTESNELTSSL